MATLIYHVSQCLFFILASLFLVQIYQQNLQLKSLKK